MVKKKQVPKKTLKKALPTSNLKKKKDTTKPSSMKAKVLVKAKVKKSSSTVVKKTPSTPVRQKSIVSETGETTAQKMWKEKKRDYWQDQFGQLLASLSTKGKGKKQVV